MKLHQAEHSQDEAEESEDEEKRVHMNASRRLQKARGAFLACGRVITLPRVENAATGFLANPCGFRRKVLERMMSDLACCVNDRPSGCERRS